MTDEKKHFESFLETDFAFPSPCVNNQLHDHGMTLLDYFAAKAMEAYIASESYQFDNESTISKDSYNVAEAMMRERKKRMGADQ